MKTTKCGENPVLRVGIVLSPLATSPIHSHHRVPSPAPTKVLNPVFKVRTYLSTYPLARGLLVAMRLCPIALERRYRSNSPQYSRPLSVRTRAGTPYRHTTSRWNHSATSWELRVGTVPISTHLVKGSMASIMSVAPSGAGGVKLTAESKHQTRKGAAAFSAGCKYGGGRNLAASLYLAMLAFAKMMQSVFKPRQ